MEEYINEYKKILSFIERIKTDIKLLRSDVSRYKSRINLLDDEIHDKIGNLEADIKFLESEKSKIETINNNNVVLRGKLKKNLIFASIFGLISSILFLFFGDAIIFVKFLTAISAALTFLFTSNSCECIYSYLKNKRIVDEYNIDALNTIIENKKNEVNQFYYENRSLLSEKNRLEKRVRSINSTISDNNIKLNHLKYEADSLSKLVLHSIHDDVISSCDREIEGQLVISGVNTFVRKKCR